MSHRLIRAYYSASCDNPSRHSGILNIHRHAMCLIYRPVFLQQNASRSIRECQAILDLAVARDDSGDKQTISKAWKRNLHSDRHHQQPTVSYHTGRCPSYRPTNAIKVLNADTDYSYQHQWDNNSPFSVLSVLTRVLEAGGMQGI